MDYKEIAIATNTSYPKWYTGKLKDIGDTDKIRGDLAVEFCQKASEAGYRVALVDSNSPPAFFDTVSRFKSIYVIKEEHAKRSVARRLAIKTAAKWDVKVIVLTEPEKSPFITDCISVTVDPILNDQYDIVLAKREDSLFRKTYPTFQYKSEVEANILINELYLTHGFLSFLDIEPDMIFGPRVFKNSPSVIECFMKKYIITADVFPIFSEFIDPEQVLNTMFFPIILAERQGLKIQNVIVPFEYPTLQKQNEEIAEKQFVQKRRNQKMGIIIGLMHFFSFLEGKDSKIKESL